MVGGAAFGADPHAVTALETETSRLANEGRPTFIRYICPGWLSSGPR